MTPESAQAALEALGAPCRLEDIQLQLRGDRGFAFLPGHRLAVFPVSGTAALRVARERAVLRALEHRCSFRTPRILAEAPDSSCDLRMMVPGVHATSDVYDRVRDDAPNAQRMGTALGNMIAEVHIGVRLTDLSMQLPTMPEWPESRAWIRERLPHVIDDPALEAAADHIIARFEDSAPAGAPVDRVLVHTDLGLHIVSIDSDTLTVHGIFDWEGGCWSDRHFDFRHLLQEEGEAYAAKLGQAGVRVTAVRYNQTIHDFAMLSARADTPAVRGAVQQAISALRSALYDTEAAALRSNA